MTADVTPDDRLGLTIVLAIIVHAMVVLGVSFAPEPGPEPGLEALEVILVPERSRAPEEADFLAQANLEGGGDADESTRPAAPVKAPLPAPVAALAAAPPPPIAPPAPATPPPPPATEAEGRAPVEEKLVQEVREAPLAMPPPQEPAPATPAPEPAVATVPSPPAEVHPEPLPTAAQLLTRSFALASLNAELQQRLDSRAKRPRRKYISANTREYRYAAYMEAWRAKVERIGNINYPEEARQRQLSGSLLLDVALTPDGKVDEITVRRSSGHKVLDDAAVRIVELAAPFAPFPDDIRREVDILHVTRTWRFLNNQQFSAR
jgi:protein TonB